MYQWSENGIIITSCKPPQARTAWDRPLTHMFLSWGMWIKNRMR